MTDAAPTSTDPRRPAPAWRHLSMAVVISLCLVAAACGSSSGSSSTGSTGGATGTTANPASGCPFSGQTAPSSGKAQTEVASSLSRVTTRKDDCIDNVQFDFTPGVPAWTVGYQPGPFTDKAGKALTPPGTYYLVVEFQGVAATYAGPTSVSGANLNYVKQVTEATGADGADEWVISLDQKLAYTTSVSSTPAYFVLGLG